MSHTQASVPASHQSYIIAVSVKRNGFKYPIMDVTVNGVTTRHVVKQGTNHEAVYLGVIRALTDAQQKGALTVDISTGKQQTAREQLSQVWAVDDPVMSVLFAAVRIMERSFSKVSYN